MKQINGSKVIVVGKDLMISKMDLKFLKNKIWWCKVRKSKKISKKCLNQIETK